MDMRYFFEKNDIPSVFC